MKNNDLLLNINNFQRLGSLNNAAVGADFENTIQLLFEKTYRVTLAKQISVEIGVGIKKKQHLFDLGNSEQKIVIECKSHTWTQGNNIPSAKLTVWNEAMYYFSLLPADYKKYFVVLRDLREDESLASYYIKNYYHLIPEDVVILEYDPHIQELIIMARS